MDFIEVSAKNVDDAITEASIQLGTTSDNIEYEVLRREVPVSLELEARTQSLKLVRNSLQKEMFVISLILYSQQ